MDEEPELVTKKRTGDIILVCCLGLLMTGLGVFFINRGFTEDEYMQLIPVLCGLFFIFIAGIVFFAVRLLVSYRLYDDRLEVISVTGKLSKTIWLSTITSWSETIVKNGVQLALYMPGDKCIIQSRGVKEDYDALKEKLTGDKKKVEWKTDIVLVTRMAYVGLIISMGFFVLARHQYKTEKMEIQPQDITTVKGIKVNNSGISRTGGRSSRNYIRIILDRYPGFVFTIDYSAYQATQDREYANDVRPGDSLYIDILTDVYQKKISREKPLGFFDKTIDYRKIDVYGLRNPYRSFLTVENYNKAAKGDTRFGGFIIIGIIVFGFAMFFFLIVYYKKLSGDAE